MAKIKKRKIKRKTRSKPKAKTADRGKRYALNRSYELLPELSKFILKASPAEKSKMISRINKLGRTRLAVLSGVFVDKDNLDPLVPDLFLVIDDVDRRKLRMFLKSLEAEVGKELKFAVMNKEEFSYRSGMFDRFIRVLLEGPHEKLIDKIGLDQQ